TLAFRDVADVNEPFALTTEKFHVANRTLDRMKPTGYLNDRFPEKSCNTEPALNQFDLSALVAANSQNQFGDLSAFPVALIFANKRLSQDAW
ncbi:MAG TPA: hypothetical protein VFO40_26015, partial [Chthoniobacterales bacterium]|nr:hypothetical protein [Chthoniobacterales bacterium]